MKIRRSWEYIKEWSHVATAIWAVTVLQSYKSMFSSIASFLNSSNEVVVQNKFFTAQIAVNGTVHSYIDCPAMLLLVMIVLQYVIIIIDNKKKAKKKESLQEIQDET